MKTLEKFQETIYQESMFSKIFHASTQRHIQIPVKYLRQSFFKNS